MLRYAITDRRCGWARLRLSAADALIEQAARLAARGDIDYLQLREKDLPAAALAALARRISRSAAHACARSRPGAPKLLINSRADVAIAAGADGVHLTSSPGEITPAQVRSLYCRSRSAATPIVSLSCHSLEDVRAAHSAAPNLILLGPVFEKRVGDLSSVAKVSGLELLRQACTAAAPMPVLALGGITDETATECLATGATGVSQAFACSQRKPHGSFFAGTQMATPEPFREPLGDELLNLGESSRIDSCPTERRAIRRVQRPEHLPWLSTSVGHSNHVRWVLFALYYAILSNIPFGAASRWLGLLPVGWFCAEYAQVGLLALFIPGWLAAALLFVTMAGDLIAAVGKTYYLGPFDCLSNTALLLQLPMHRLSPSQWLSF